VGRKPRVIAEQPQEVETPTDSEEGKLIKSILRRSLRIEPKVDFIPTGILPFDALVGGVPIGHITLIGGLPGSGKTLFCLKLTATHLKGGGTVVYADTEGSTTPQRLETTGVPIDLLDKRLFLRHYIMLEDCLTDIKNLLIRLAESNKEKRKFLIILDSLSSLLPVKWEEVSSGEKGLISDAPIGVFARTGSIFLAGLPNLLLEANAALVITTQMRADISMGGRGAPFKMFKFYALEHLSRLTVQLYTPEVFTPPFVSALELEEDEKDKVVSLKGAYHKVRVGFKKAQVFASQAAVPPNLDISFFYPIVEIPQIGLRAGDVDNIYHVLVYGVLTEVLYKEVKPGIGTVFYFPIDTERVVRFTYLDAYKKPKLRELLLTEAAERIKQKISQILAAKTKGREIFSEEEDEDDEDAEIESTPTVDKVEELDGDEED
jgi:RecA/RadA recombinase